MTGLAFTYTTLTNAAQTWLDDTDSDWVNATTLAQLVYLSENRVTIDLDLTIFDTVSTGQSYASSNTTGLVARPSGIIVTDALGYLIPTGSPSAGKFVPILLRDYGWVKDYLVPGFTGPPQYYAEVDITNWIIAPFPDVTYGLVNWGPYAPASLNDSGSATWLSTNVSELLLLAMLVEVSLLLKNTARLSAAMTDYTAKLSSDKVRMRALRRKDMSVLQGEGLGMPDGKTPASNPAQE